MGDAIQNVLLVPLLSMALTLPRDSMIPVNMGANFGKFVIWGRFFGVDFDFQDFGVYLPSQRRYIIMLIIDSKDCENIDKALKKYKKKFEKAKVLVQLRERQSFMKPSVRRRTQVLKAVYKQQVATGKFE
jgi:small subunit ribosomal protein S21